MGFCGSYFGDVVGFLASKLSALVFSADDTNIDHQLWFPEMLPRCRHIVYTVNVRC